MELTLTSMCSRLTPLGYPCENNRVLDNGRVAGSLTIDLAELGQMRKPRLKSSRFKKKGVQYHIQLTVSITALRQNIVYTVSKITNGES